MRRRVAGAVLALALLAGVAGCTAPGVACPDIGWINTVRVDASTFGSDVFVQLCVDAGCTAGPGEEPTPSSVMGAPVQNEDGVFSLNMTTPDEATIRVYDAGTLVHESDHDISWTLPTDTCGGPGIAETIISTP